MTTDIVNFLKKKARQSNCRFRVSAIGLNHKGEIVGSTFNHLNLPKRNGGVHAEVRLLRRYGNHIKTIIICRVGHGGDIRPIRPCVNCYKVATKMGVKIISIQ